MIKLKLNLLLIVILFGAVSCSVGGEGTGKALVNIRLIDAPGDFDEAWIEILGVEILQSRSRGNTVGQETFVEYQQSKQQVDISKLVNEGILLIGRAEIPVGEISQLKLVLGEDHFLMKDGNRRSLHLNNPGEAEIDIKVNYTVEGSLSYDIYLDFDLGKSVIGTSDPNRFILSPVVRSFVRSETSEMGGRIRPAEARPVLFAIQDTDTVTTLTDAQGAYMFRGLREGAHTLYINPREPYLDTMFTVGTETGMQTLIEDVVLRLPAED